MDQIEMPRELQQIAFDYIELEYYVKTLVWSTTV